jgi:uncharacterized protein (TIGR00255 family)
MIRSMTGYGSAAAESAALRATVTVRSLNHRFLEMSVHLPRRLQPMEREIRDLVQSRLSRGRIELAVQATMSLAAAEGGDVVVASRPLVASFVRTLRDMQNEFGLDGNVAVADLIRFPGALERLEAPLPPESEARGQIIALVAQALDVLIEMRGAEGARSEGDLLRGLALIEQSAGRMHGLAEGSREPRRQALAERLRELCGELGLEDARLYQEVVRAVERHDVTEELQRLGSHVAMARELLLGQEPAGKRLDFLAQELAREANTLGSKAADAAMVREVVNLKAEIEKVREQVQNVE